MLIAHPEKSLPFLLDEKKFPTIVRVWILFWYDMGEKFRGVEPCFDKSLRTDYTLPLVKKSAQIILSRTIFNSSVKRPRLGCSIDYFSPRGPISRCIVVHQSPVVRCPIIVNDAQRRRTRFYNCDRCTINFTRRILRYAANQLKGLNISLYDLDRYMKMSTHFLYIFPRFHCKFSSFHRSSRFSNNFVKKWINNNKELSPSVPFH